MVLLIIGAQNSKEVKLRMGIVIVGVLLAMIGSTIFLYGLYAMNTGDLLSNTFLIITGIFLGMAGLLILLTQVFPGFSIFR